jgi:hypothetical protein
VKRTTRDFEMKIAISRRERDTILAALHVWYEMKTAERSGMASAIASDFARPLPKKAIEELRDRLNFSRVKHK